MVAVGGAVGERDPSRVLQDKSRLQGRGAGHEPAIGRKVGRTCEKRPNDLVSDGTPVVLQEGRPVGASRGPFELVTAEDGGEETEHGRHADLDHTAGQHLSGQRRWNRRLWRGLARAPEAMAGRPVAVLSP